MSTTCHGGSTSPENRTAISIAPRASPQITRSSTASRGDRVPRRVLPRLALLRDAPTVGCVICGPTRHATPKPRNRQQSALHEGTYVHCRYVRAGVPSPRDQEARARRADRGGGDRCVAIRNVLQLWRLPGRWPWVPGY